MNGGNRVIAGFRLDGGTRLSELGMWADGTAPDGRPVAALLFDNRLVADAAARQRLAAAVTADRHLTQSGPAGLLPVADLVGSAGEVWLLIDHPAGPTVTDLLNAGAAGAGPDAGSAAAVLVETAQTLLTIHSAGLAHGALQPGTIVLGEDGAALLAERGLLDALHGRTPAPQRDVAAWASLARGLAATWGAGSPGGAALLEQAATTATTHGLAAARDTLLSGRDRLPGGHIGRERLVGMVRWWRDHHTAATGPAGLAAVPAGRPQDEGEIVTLLHVPAPVQAERAPEQPETADVRFGPGVPSMSTAEQIWRSGREQATVYGQEHHRESRLATRRRRRTAVAAATLALIVAGALLAWLLRDPGPVLAVEKVDVKAPRRTQGCDSTVVINGVITTNGGDGRVRYEWRRSDSKKPIVQEETVTADTTSYQVSLRWTVKGEGSFKATATLRILDPEPAGKPMEDRATFTYRCR